MAEVATRWVLHGIEERVDAGQSDEADEAQRLRRALQDPSTWIADERRARVSYVLRADVLETVAAALRPTSLSVLLVKGAGLAATVYEHPWQRQMADVDLLVDPADLEAVLEALRAGGLQVAPIDSARRLSARHLGERAVTVQTAGIEWLIEVHDQLDKLVARPIPYRALAKRSVACAELEPLRAPSREDHALLVIVHLASAEFDHPMAWVDLSLLIAQDFDWDAFERRARRWRLRTPAYLTLETLATLDGSAVPDGVTERLRPGFVRRYWLRRMYRAGGYPVSKKPLRLGWRWVLRQTPLRDDSLRWLGGLIRYAWRRTIERLF